MKHDELTPKQIVQLNAWVNYRRYHSTGVKVRKMFTDIMSMRRENQRLATVGEITWGEAHTLNIHLWSQYEEVEAAEEVEFLAVKQSLIDQYISEVFANEEEDE